MEKSQCFIQSTHCKKIMCRDKRGRPYYGIANGELLSIDHLISLFVYCNFNALQRVLKSSYTRATDNKSNDELKLRHSTFHHLGKYLRESVEVFGVNAYPSKINNFYHGISEQIVLSHSEFYLNSILSCTSKLSVAIYYSSPYFCHSSSKTLNTFSLETKKFAADADAALGLEIEDDNHLILNFSAGCSFFYYSANFFDCRWISEFSNESECLFVGHEQPLFLKSILYPCKSFDFERYLNAIRIIKNTVLSNDNHTN